MRHGGKRKGAGRKEGAINNDRREFLALIDKVADTEHLVGKLKELVDGVTVRKKTKDGPVIYEKPPDAFAITYLLDQRYGKARQTVDVTHDNTYEQLLIGIGKSLVESGQKISSARTGESAE